MSDDDPNAYNKNVNRRIQQELDEFHNDRVCLQQAKSTFGSKANSTWRKRRWICTSAAVIWNGGRKLLATPSPSATATGGSGDQA